jgi:hypothetical protein
MALLILLVIAASWGALLYGVTYSSLRRFGSRRARKTVAAVAAALLAPLPIVDEVVGAWQFSELCAIESRYEISPATLGRRFDLRYSSTEPTARPSGIRPIDQKTITFTDVATGEVLATGPAFFAHGGWLVRRLGFPSSGGGKGPLIGRQQCFPGDSASQAARMHSITNRIVN